MEMEEMMMMMINRKRSPENLRIESISNDTITTSTTNCPTWKLYENPFYTNTHKQNQNQNHQLENKASTNQLKQIHHLQLPISARKIAASFWDLTFIRPFMESELGIARAKITVLKAELEQERKARKKAESMNKKQARELSEVKKGRKALERLCKELAKEVSSDKAEINKMHKDMAEERKMLRMAEVLREERVQMKLADAKLLLEEKLTELEATKATQIHPQLQIDQSKAEANITREAQRHRIRNTSDNSSRDSSGEEIKPCVLVEKSASTVTHSNSDSPTGSKSNPTTALVASQRRASPEPENPHIKRGIKGFVEFPKVIRAIGSKSRYLGTKSECQGDQLKILLKQKTPIRSATLITS